MTDETKSISDLLNFLKPPALQKDKPLLPLSFTEFFHQTLPRKEAIATIRLENNPIFNKLVPFQVQGARLALNAITIAVRMKYIDVNKLKRIADFGAGIGGPTFALVEIAKVLGGQVSAIEQDERLATKIVDLGISPKDNVRIEDGIQHISNVKNTGAEGYDLVTSFMLGPDMPENYFATWHVLHIKD
ncbi:MAG: hypothetical protein NZM26_01340 [Patescibacteria group bacterium]|nr:hypothetical protein [Patescibacteria group bacterium]